MDYFRLATPQDIEALKHIDSVATAERAQNIQQWINEKNCYLIERQSQIIAYGVLHYRFLDVDLLKC